MVDANLFIKNSKFNINFELGPNSSLKVIAPFYHEDGDIIEVFLCEDCGKYKLSDFGMTLMKLSYYIDIDSDSKVETLNNILNANGIDDNEGVLSLPTSEDTFVEDLSKFCLTIAKVTNMDILSKNFIVSMFTELIDDYFEKNIKTKYNFERKYKPLANSDIVVDYKVEIKGLKAPIFIFPIRTTLQALRTAYDCLEMKEKKLQSINIGICEDYTKIDKKDYKKLTCQLSKCYSDRESFEENIDETISEYIEIANA